MDVDEHVAAADDRAAEPVEEAGVGEPADQKHKQKDKAKKRHKHKHKKEKHKGEAEVNGLSVEQAIAVDDAPPASDAPSAAPAGDVTADTLPAIDAGPSEAEAAAALTADDPGGRAEAADTAAVLPESDKAAAATTTTMDGVPAVDGITANGAATAVAADGGSDRESGELEAAGPNSAEAGGTSAAAGNEHRHASKDGKERSKHKHHSSELKRRRSDDDGKHGSKRSRREGGGDYTSNHGTSHRKRSQREREGAADTAAADGGGAARDTDATAGGDAVMVNAAAAEEGPPADPADPATNGAVVDEDEKRRAEADAKRDRGPSKERKRDRSRERSRGGGHDDSERRREDRRDRERSSDRRRDRDAATGDRGAARDADRHRSRDRERDSERERERREAAEREKALLEARLAERKRERERREKERERESARPSSRDPRDADRRDPRDRDRDEGRGRYDRREPYGGRDYRQGGRDADRGYRDGRDRGRDYDRDRGRDHRDRDGGRDRDRDRGGRRSERDEEAPIDPEKEAQLLAALEQDSSDEEARAIEERRQRMAAIKAKHQAALMVTEPTATAQAAARGAADAGQTADAAPQSAGATPARPGAQETPERPTDQLTPDRAEASGAGMPRVESRADSVAGGPTSAPPTPRANSEPSDSDDDEQRGGQGDGEMDIWQRGGDDAARDDAGQAAGDGEPAHAAGAGSGPGPQRDSAGETRGADVSEAEFASEAQKAQEQTQAGRAATTAELDMFAEVVEEPDGAAAAAAEESTVVHEGPRGAAARAGLADSFDDKEGYYTFTVGEVVDDRYEVFATHGRGVFSSVLRAKDLLSKAPAGSPHAVAIKIIRANETMYKAGQTEKVILRKLGSLDPEGKRHVIRLLRHFDYRGHLCLVFEPMAMNLREITKKVGRNIGLNLPAVQLFTKQLLLALHHFRDCGVLHADIKPDNILINDRHNAVKVCDFGSAMFEGDNAITPYLVSRFYRPPEVILGLPYGALLDLVNWYPLDMWSIGCVVYELFTGRILFNGRTNNEMLKKMMDVKGPFPKRMLKKGAFTTKHFESDPGMSFKLYEDDPVTRKPIVRLVANPKVVHDFAALFRGGKEDVRHTAHLADLLEKMLALDPDKRIRPKDALKHPFVKWGRAVEGGGGIRR